MVPVFQLAHEVSYDEVYEKLRGCPLVSKLFETEIGIIRCGFKEPINAEIVISPRTRGMQVWYKTVRGLRLVFKFLESLKVIEAKAVRPLMLDKSVSLDFILPHYRLVKRKEDRVMPYIGGKPSPSGIHILTETWKNSETGELISRINNRFLFTRPTRKSLYKLERFIKEVDRLNLWGKPIIARSPEAFLINDKDEYYLVNRKTGQRIKISPEEAEKF